MSERNRIRVFWKPNGKTKSVAHERKMRKWMEHHALSTAPGALTVLIHSPVHESARHHLVRALSIPEDREKRRSLT